MIPQVAAADGGAVADADAVARAASLRVETQASSPAEDRGGAAGDARAEHRINSGRADLDRHFAGPAIGILSHRAEVDCVALPAKHQGGSSAERHGNISGRRVDRRVAGLIAETD